MYVYVQYVCVCVCGCVSICTVLFTMGTIQQYNSWKIQHDEKRIHFERRLERLLAFLLYFIAISARSELCKSLMKLTVFPREAKLLTGCGLQVWWSIENLLVTLFVCYASVPPSVLSQGLLWSLWRRTS